MDKLATYVQDSSIRKVSKSSKGAKNRQRKKKEKTHFSPKPILPCCAMCQFPLYSSRFSRIEHCSHAKNPTENVDPLHPAPLHRLRALHSTYRYRYRISTRVQVQHSFPKSSTLYRQSTFFPRSTRQQKKKTSPKSFSSQLEYRQGNRAAHEHKKRKEKKSARNTPVISTSTHHDQGIRYLILEDRRRKNKPRGRVTSYDTSSLVIRSSGG